jgi:hypothetical protein
MSTLGLSCILAGEPVIHPAVVACYAIDEPEVQRMSIGDQDVLVAGLRAKTTLPLAIACIEEIEQQCSMNFDWYMQDIYYSSKLSKLRNYLNAAISSQMIQILYKGKTVMPIVGLYDDEGPFVFEGETQHRFNKFFRSMFPTQDYAAFWYTSMAARPEYMQWAREMNRGNKVSWFIRPLAYVAAWCVVKINPLLGKYKIVIGA